MTLCTYCGALAKHQDDHNGLCCDCFDISLGQPMRDIFAEGRWRVTLARNLWIAAGLGMAATAREPKDADWSLEPNELKL